MTTRKELVEALRLRYRGASFGDRIKILDEFVALTGYHRKHAIRVLREQVAAVTSASDRNRLYNEAVRQTLTVLWEAADRVCGKRLKVLIPILVDAMERHGHLDLDQVIRTMVLQVSAATIDRVLAATRLHIDGQRKRRKGIGSAIRRSIPVRTFADWRDPPPGFFEIDMVEHCGGVKTEGEFVHTLTMTDIATGWTECVAVRMREQMLVVASFDTVGLLSQWRGYGADGGFAIVFDTAGLEALWPQENEPERGMAIFWGNVEYFTDPEIGDGKYEETRALSETVVASLAKHLQSGKSIDLVNMFTPVVQLACLMKHWGFEEESEVRFIIANPSKELFNAHPSSFKLKPIHSFLRDGAPVPHMRLLEDVAKPAAGRLPIRRIIVGPHPERDARQIAVEVLLSQNGYSDVPVDKSVIPYRGR
jgi:hypothetical protein